MKKLPFSTMFIIVILFIVTFVLNSFIYIVNEKEHAIILRFGNPIKVRSDANIYTKLPIDEVIILDKRNLEFDVDPPVEILAKNQEALNVDAFVRYRIDDPLLFYQSFKMGLSTGSVIRARAEATIGSVLENALRGALGQVTVEDIITNERSKLMRTIGDNMESEAVKFGVSIIDIKIRRADLPETNAEKVFSRMRSERQEVAQKIRAEGDRDARIIMAEVDKRSVEIVALAQEKAERRKGQADALATKTFAAAYEKDPQFYSFYRSLEAYEKTFSGNKKQLFILTPDNEFLKGLNNEN